jgi:hypothetical protein
VLLKEKLRGSSLGMSRPQSGQAIEEEYSWSGTRSAPPFAPPLVTEADEHQAVGHLQRLGDRGFEALLDSRLEYDAIDDRFDRVVLALVELDAVREVAQFAVDAGAEALLVELVEQVFELALAAAHDGA